MQDFVRSHRSNDVDDGYRISFCKPVPVWNMHAPTQLSNCSVCQTRTGKQGPAGPRGRAGPPGLTGSVDTSVLDSLQQDIHTISGKLTNVENNGNAMTTKISNLQFQLKELACRYDGVMHGSSCYFVLDRAYNFDSAIQACTVRGGHLAYIKTADIFDAIIPYLRVKVKEAGAPHLYFRHGATYNPSSGVPYDSTYENLPGTLTDNGGNQITFLDNTTAVWNSPWHPNNYPRLSAGWTSMMFCVVATKSSSDGFWNYITTAEYRPICENEM